MSAIAYANNNEDFDWDDPHECLRDWFDNLDEIDHPDTWRIYHGAVTDIALIEPEGSFRVEPIGFTDYLLTAGTSAGPEWIVKE